MPALQAVAAQLASLEPADESFAGFMDAETATFASRLRRLMRSKVEELQASTPGLDPGRQPLLLLSPFMLHRPSASSAASARDMQALAPSLSSCKGFQYIQARWSVIATPTVSWHPAMDRLELTIGKHASLGKLSAHALFMLLQPVC